MSKQPKKRGRKPKKKKDQEKPPPKKRGRKPKGGKIIKKNTVINKNNVYIPNVILHLKTSVKKLENINNITNIIYKPNISDPISFSLTSNKTSALNFGEIKNANSINNENISLTINQNKVEKKSENKKSEKLTKNSMKEIWEKLQKLSHNLRHNNVSDKACSCFWDSCSFDSPPIYIPKKIKDDKIYVYGCFCSPECALSYLKQENLDSSTMWHRNSLLNIIYGSIYNYEKNIKPAPNPYYTLDKYYGNFTISEWRKLLNNDRLIMVVDKPMSKMLPEIYEENNEEPNITNNLLDSNKTNRRSYKLKSKEAPKSKSDILKNNFRVF